MLDSILLRFHTFCDAPASNDTTFFTKTELHGFWTTKYKMIRLRCIVLFDSRFLRFGTFYGEYVLRKIEYKSILFMRADNVVVGYIGQIVKITISK